MFLPKNINRKLIPGITKALELHVIVHLMDKEVSASGIKFNKKGNKFVAENFSEERFATHDARKLLEAASGMPSGGSKKTTPGSSRSAGGLQKKIPTAPIAVSPPSMGGRGRTQEQPLSSVDTAALGKISEDVGMQPTWTTVSTQRGTKLIGVKVVPFFIKDEKEMLDFLYKDLARKGAKKFLEKNKRQFLRLMWKVVYLFMERPGATGLLMKDVILARTKNRDNIFMCLNANSLKDSDEMRETKNIRKLFGMKWPNIVILDDIDHMASFCMKEYTGICSTVSYEWLFNQTRQTKEVYENLAQASSAATSIFSRKKSTIDKVLSAIGRK